MPPFRKSWLIFHDLKKAKGGQRPFAFIQARSVADPNFRVRPVAFNYKDQEFAVQEVEDCWHEGSIDSGRSPQIYFKVLTTDRRRFILRFDPIANEWAILVQ